MLHTTVINHKRTTRKRIKCVKCLVEYSKEDYQTLYENKKLAYFTFPPRTNNIFCHDCFYKKIVESSVGEDKEIKILVKDNKNEYIITIETEE
jgi:hypothetical protein